MPGFENMVVWAFWTSKVYRGRIYLPETHWRYVEFVAARFSRVKLIVPCEAVDFEPHGKPVLFENVDLVQAPLRKGYEKYLVDVLFYAKLFNGIPRSTQIYLRAPDPLRWLPALMGFENITYHFVGNAIEVLESGGSVSLVQRAKIAIFKLEQSILFRLISLAKKNRVFANGEHLANYLASNGVHAKAVVSSTLRDFERCDFQEKSVSPLRLIHIGYLRSSKNLDLLIDVVKKTHESGCPVSFDIVGDGEYRSALERQAQRCGVGELVTFYGHVDSREKLAELISKANIFVFSSLSEGSPRVVVEAMAFGALVVSTPVGSLPTTFANMREIVFSEPTVDAFVERILTMHRDEVTYNKIRRAAYDRVWTTLTLDKFLSEIFCDA